MWIEALFEAQKVQLYDARGANCTLRLTRSNCTRGSTVRYKLGPEHKRVPSKESRRRRHERQGTRGEQVFGIPFTYSAMGLIFDKRQLPEPPTSMAALWDPALQGKVVIYNGGTHNFSLAAMAMGWPCLFSKSLSVS